MLFKERVVNIEWAYSGMVGRKGVNRECKTEIKSYCNILCPKNLNQCRALVMTIDKKKIYVITMVLFFNVA